MFTLVGYHLCGLLFLAELSYVFPVGFFVLNPISSFWSSLDGVGLCFLCAVETYMDPSYFPPDNYAS